MNWIILFSYFTGGLFLFSKSPPPRATTHWHTCCSSEIIISSVWVVTDTLTEWVVCPMWWCVCVCVYILICILTLLGSMDSAAFVMPSKHFPTMGSTWRSTSANVFIHTPILSILFSSMSWSFYIKMQRHSYEWAGLCERAVVSYWASIPSGKLLLHFTSFFMLDPSFTNSTRDEKWKLKDHEYVEIQIFVFQTLKLVQNSCTLHNDGLLPSVFLTCCKCIFSSWPRGEPGSWAANELTNDGTQMNHSGRLYDQSVLLGTLKGRNVKHKIPNIYICLYLYIFCVETNLFGWQPKLIRCMGNTG